MRARLIETLLLAACMLVAACAVPAYRANPDLANRAPAIKTILLASPKVEVFELGVGGMREKMDDWTEQGTKNVAAALANALNDRSAIRMKALAEDALSPERKTKLEEMSALFDAANNEIILHTYGAEPERFKEKLTAFDYSLGPEVEALSAGEGEALLFVRAADYVSSKGRIAAQMATMIIGAALGVAVIPQTGNTLLSVALVDGKSGQILWYRFVGGPGFDLRESSSATRLIQNVLKDLPLSVNRVKREDTETER